MKYYILLPMLSVTLAHGGGFSSKQNAGKMERMGKLLLYEVSDGTVVSVHMNSTRNSDWKQYVCNNCGVDMQLVFKTDKSPFSYCSKHIVEYHPDLLETILTKHHKESGIGKIVSIELEYENC